MSKVVLFYYSHHFVYFAIVLEISTMIPSSQEENATFPQYCMENNCDQVATIPKDLLQDTQGISLECTIGSVTKLGAF